jgi:XTP/dITP diphosphohydrolase
MRVVLATTNTGKIFELTRALSSLGIQTQGLDDLAGNDEVETGSTFEENALLKARHYHGLSGLITIADDSGLEVQALGGAPGVRSARYAGPNATDSERTRRLLQEMRKREVSDRAARFVCAAAIAWNEGERVFVGTVDGVILNEPRGKCGFGYDPVFYYPPIRKTFAELEPDEKWEVSHRGKAFRLLADWLARTKLLVDTAGYGDRITVPAQSVDCT